MSTAVPIGGHDRFDDYYLAGGIEVTANPRATIGFAFSYSQLSGTTSQGGQQSRAHLY